MSASRPEAFKGWSKCWYVGENPNADLKCPAPGCDEVFRTGQAIRDRAIHFGEEQDPDTKFFHDVLDIIEQELHCLKCKWVDSRDNKALGERDCRDFFKHERDVHWTDDFPDPKKFVGLMRKYRFRRFVDDGHLYHALHEFFIRNIQKQPDFEEFKEYLRNYCKIDTTAPPEVYLEIVLAKDRGSHPPEGLTATQKKFFPVDRDEFLYSFSKPEDRADGSNIRDVYRVRYAETAF